MVTVSRHANQMTTQEIKQKTYTTCKKHKHMQTNNETLKMTIHKPCIKYWNKYVTQYCKYTNTWPVTHLLSLLFTDDDKIEAELKSDLNSDIQKLIPNVDDHHRQLQQLIDDILDQKVAKTDMKLRHIVTKGIEVNWHLPQLLPNLCNKDLLENIFNLVQILNVVEQVKYISLYHPEGREYMAGQIDSTHAIFCKPAKKEDHLRSHFASSARETVFSVVSVPIRV